MYFKTAFVFALTSIGVTPALAQTARAVAQDYGDTFTDGANSTKVHISGFVCPAQLGHFERDAAGQADIETGADFCAYSALDGVYGTVTLVPLAGPYDAKSALVPDFVETESTGGKRIAETTVKVETKGAETLAVYARTYQTAELESLHYRVEFTGAAVRNWAVETTIEYADPRDTQVAQSFFDEIYRDALERIGAK
jgi:hypothetical protein